VFEGRESIDSSIAEFLHNHIVIDDMDSGQGSVHIVDGWDLALNRNSADIGGTEFDNRFDYMELDLEFDLEFDLGFGMELDYYIELGNSEWVQLTHLDHVVDNHKQGNILDFDNDADMHQCIDSVGLLQIENP
jgi:hypothetical protein